MGKERPDPAQLRRDAGVTMPNVVRFPRRYVSLAVLALLLFTAVPGCSRHVDPSPATTDPVTSSLVRDTAVAYLLRSDVITNVDPLVMVLMAWIGSNWDMAQLDGLYGRAADMAEAELLGGIADTPSETATLARLVLPELRTPVADISPPARGERSTTAGLHAALYCDVRPLAATDAAHLEALAAGEGYDPTHALLAALWARDLGCADPFWATLQTTSTNRVAKEFSARLANAQDLAAVVDDISIEQAVLLVHTGRQDVVPAGWLDAVRRRQLPDGGWSVEAWEESTPAEAIRSDWHPTLLALWLFWAAESPGRGLPMVRAGS
jgi:hypothetical protein